MGLSRPFTSDSPEVNELIDWIIRNFSTREEANRAFLRELNSGINETRDSQQRNGEIRYRIFDDQYGKYLQPVIIHNGIDYPLFAHSQNRGTPRLLGDQTVWDDMRVPGESVGLGSSAPDLGTFLGAGNLEVLLFDGSGVLTEEVFFEVQMPHHWREGSDIYPHIHWTPVDGNSGNVKWQLEYTWANINDVFPAVTTINGVDAAAGTAWTHQLCSMTAIAGTDKTLSSMLVCRLFRDPTDGSDTYEHDAALLEIDFHYQKDGLGSDYDYKK